MKRWLGIGALWLAGCSADSANCDCVVGADAGGELDGAESAAVAEFCAGALGPLALAYESCCTEEDKLTLWYKAAHGMAAAIAWECQAKVGKSVSQGRARLQTDAAASCLQAIGSAVQGAGCAIVHSGWDWESTACRGAILGLQAEGEACRYRYECEDGLTCEGYTDGVDGQCKALREGGTCRLEEYSGAADDVMDALFGEHPACMDGWTCQHTDQLGLCAKQSAAGGYCVTSQDCALGLSCHVGQCGDGARSELGGECIVSSDCAQGLYCEPATQPGSWGTCEQKKAVGEPCSTAAADACWGYCGAGQCVALCGSR